MLTDQEVENVKNNISGIVTAAIREVYRGFEELDNTPLRSFNNKKRELKDYIISALTDLEVKIKSEL